MRFMPLHHIKRYQIPLAQYGRLLAGGRHGSRRVDALARIGTLQVRQTRRMLDIRAAQRLRYQVFYEEMGARADARTKRKRRDADRFDSVCEHLVVSNRTAARQGTRPLNRIIGTCRLQARDAREIDHFYSAGEFDLAPIAARNPQARLLEIGRSCVLPGFRNTRTMELIWHGIWAYAQEECCDVMIGCASMSGINPDKLELPLSFLHHFASAPAQWSARAHAGRHVPMDRMAREDIDVREAIAALPPLLRAYLRLGATFGDGAVIDEQFNTTDVLVILPVAAIGQRYRKHFSRAVQAA